MHHTGIQSCLTIVSIIVENANVDIEGLRLRFSKKKIEAISELLLVRKRKRMEWVLNLQYYRGRNVKVRRKLLS